MKTVYAYTHMGLGDMITANGMIRTFCESYDRVFVFCKPHNMNNVKFMYRDEPKIKLIPMDDRNVMEFMFMFPTNEYKIIGHAAFNHIYYQPNNTKKIDEIFYELAEVPFENKWSKFKVVRDLSKEIQPPKEPYVFIHDKDKLNIKGIRPTMDHLLWDYLTLIENAEEIHCVNSSFYCMIEHLQINHPKMYLHQHKDWGEDMLGVIKCPWKIIR